MNRLKLHIVILITILITNHTGAGNNFLPDEADSVKSPRLLEPSMTIATNTITPTFRWHRVEDEAIEYRLLIAEKNGKTILDRWLKNDTLFTVTDPNLFKDLEVYRWTVIATDGVDFNQSITHKFWIDLDIQSDLEVRSIKPLSTSDNWQSGDDIRFEVEILNCGPSPVPNSRVILLNGNNNQNYYRPAAVEQVKLLDSILIDFLAPNQSRKVKLRGNISAGFNHFHVEIRPENKKYDRLLDNNFKSGPLIQTINDKLELNGLFVIYTLSQDIPENIQRLNEAEVKEIGQKIYNVQRFFWDHTHIVKINADTLQINRLLSDEDFSYIDDHWGYILGPWDVEKDLKRRGVSNNKYDFIYVYYPWRNSLFSWSGYRGYTYGTVETILDKSAFAAQPIITSENSNSALITIHEILHIIDHFYESNGNKSFYSPDDKELHTTFIDELDYYQWMLETWPATEWFNLNLGQKIVAKKEIVMNNQKIPQDLILHQNYPNPFNATTTITYELPGKNVFAEEQQVSLAIYSLLGKKVRTLINDYQKPGIYTINWDGADDFGEAVSSGIYIYKIRAANKNVIRKLLLIK